MPSWLNRIVGKWRQRRALMREVNSTRLKPYFYTPGLAGRPRHPKVQAMMDTFLREQEPLKALRLFEQIREGEIDQKDYYAWETLYRCRLEVLTAPRFSWAEKIMGISPNYAVYARAVTALNNGDKHALARAIKVAIDLTWGKFEEARKQAHEAAP